MKALYTLLLLGWIAYGTYLCNKKFCGPSKAKPAATTAPVKADCDVSLKFLDGDFELTTTSNFQFGGSKHLFRNMPAEGLIEDLKKVAAHLGNNPERALLIEGLYLNVEKNSDDNYDNVGLARANTIKDYLVKEIGMDEAQLIIGSKEVKRICYVKADRTAYRGANILFGEKQ